MLFAPTFPMAGLRLSAAMLFLLLGFVTNVQATDCCKPPADLEYDCDDLPYGFDPEDISDLQSLFGKPSQLCSGYTWTEIHPEVNLNSCQVGMINRRFIFIKNTGRRDTCNQVVTIEAVHEYKIYFPKDAEAYCELPNPEVLIKEELGCDLLAVSKTDARFGTGSEGCYKILRTYKVINWCEYDGESPAVQIGRDEDCDGKPGDEGVWLTRRTTGTVFLDRDEDFRNSNPSAEENDCQDNEGYWIKSSQEGRLNSVGSWKYVQHIKVYDDVRPEITFVAADPFCSYSNSCRGDVTVDFSVDETCSADKLAIKVFFFENGEAVPLTAENDIAPEALSGVFPDYQLSGRYPLGDHLFEVHVKDGCGNTGIAKIPFSVVDCKAPTPVCYHGISVSLMPLEAATDIDGDGEIDEYAMEVWVSDLLRNNSSDCTGPIKFSINRDGETPSIEQDGLLLTCNDADTVQVEVYAWDSAYNPYAEQPDGTLGGPNYQHCKTYITIREGICPEEPEPMPAMIAGRIMTYAGTPVEQVEIQVTGSMEMQTMTNNEGGFEFNVMPHQQYFLRPHKQDDLLHGVNTADAIVLTDHIMGVRLIDNPYYLIAADINNSGNVSLFDLVHLRKAILGMSESFPNNESWRFIPASHVFIDPANPWATPIPEYEAVDDMPMRWANFYAAKIGDLDGSIDDEGGRSLAAQTFLSLEDVYLEAGEVYSLEFSLAESPVLQGLQFELAFDPSNVVLEDWKEGVLTGAFLGPHRLAEGVFSVSWNNMNGEPGPLADALFSLQIRARQAGYLRDMVQLSERRIKAESYEPAGDVREITLLFTETVNEQAFRLEQNVPNPFRESTQIRFELPAAGPVRLQVFDLSGRAVYTRTAQLDAGEHVFFLSRMDLEQPGVLIYTVEAGEWRESRKMVLLP